MKKKAASRKKGAGKSIRIPGVLKAESSAARQKPLRDVAEGALRRYFDALNGDKPAGLYDMVLGEIEIPLLRTVMEFADGNQTRASEILGINRGTLRKKLKTYGLDR